MFKKLLSLTALFVLTFSVNAEAQTLRTQKFDTAQLLPRYSARPVITSKIDLQEGEYWDGYWDGTLGEYSILLGVEQVPMDYDCAAMFPASSKVVSGKIVEGIRFGFPNSTNIKNVRVWLSTTLPNTPEEADIICQQVPEVTGSENEADELNEIRFAQPYKIDPEKDLYVGYSYNVADGNSDAENFPIIIDSSKEFANGLILRFGGANGQWDDYNGYGFGVLSVQMLLSGEKFDNAASFKGELGTYVGAVGSNFNIPLVIENAGQKPMENAQITVELNGETKTVDIQPGEPVAGIGSQYDYNLTVPAPASTGSYDLKITLSKVNGQDNPIKSVAGGNIFVVSKAAKKNALVEEFTGMWCGYCPRGTVGMEKLRQFYGNDISIVAVHANDALQCYDYADVAQNVGGYPAAHINRVYTNVDPYFGLTKNSPFAVVDLVEDCISTLPTAVISGSAVIDGNILTATSDVEFLYTGDASNFAVAYILTEDGLFNEYWQQSNYFSNSEPEGLADEPLFQRWKNGTSKMSVEFNETAVAARGILRGVEGSIPASVEEGVKNSYSVEFDLNDYKVIQDRKRLNLITVLFDKTSGTVMNTNYVSLNPDLNGIDDIQADGDNIETARYTLDGRRIMAPQKGVNIVKYTDGTVKKVVVE